MGLPDAERTIEALADRMRGAVAFDAKFVGIYSGGAWIAERLAAMIDGDHPVGFIDVSFYRDDFSRKGLKPEVKRTELPFEVEGATIVLVDDVLYTGRRRSRGDQRALRLRAPGGRARQARRIAAVAPPIEPTLGARLAVARVCRSFFACRGRQARAHDRGGRCVTRSFPPKASSGTC